MNKFLNALTSVMVLCALAATGTIVRREFVIPEPGPVPGAREPVEVKAWREIASEGQRFGSSNAPVVITQFSDFQCPYCQRLHGVLTRIEEKYPSDVAFVYRHFPLDRIHPHARAAAYASECAGRMGKFREFHDELFVRQDSIGKLPWGELALRSGIAPSDTGRMGDCMEETSVIARVTADSAAGVKVGARGTPTVLINSWRLPGTPTFEQVDSIVRGLLTASK
jgi:protein-disulfide isomerase